MENNKILFTGYYGFSNMGDDAFVEVCDWGAGKYWKDSSHSFLPPSGNVKNSVNSVFKNLNFKGKYSVESLIYGYQADYLIFAGGSLFAREIQKFSAYDMFRYLSKLKITKVGAIGVSIGPFNNKWAYNEWKFFLQDFDFIYTRDTNSFQVAEEMNLNNVTQSYDLAALLPFMYGLVKKDINIKTNKTIGISICLDDKSGLIDGNDKNRIDNLIKLLRLVYFRDQNLNFIFYIINTHQINGDIEITNYVISKLDFSKERFHILPYSNVEDSWNSILNCDLMIACRLHAGIFAAFSNTPFLQIEYHRKCTDLLNDLGYPSEYRIGDLEVEIEKIYEMVTNLLNNPSDFKLTNLEKCQELALNSFVDIKL
jgi:polysaccharide pyruvyl transferase WcaK-like protein